MEEMLQEMLEVQQGVWIDEVWIRDAGLGHRLQGVIRPGEIRILPADIEEEVQSSTAGWDAFRALGSNAPAGQLDDAARGHDRYLYGKRAC